MNKISYSQLSMFSECPERWKLNYVDDLRISESNIHLIFGTSMHEVLQHYLRVMYGATAKKADEIDLNTMLRDKLIEKYGSLLKDPRFYNGEYGFINIEFT